MAICMDSRLRRASGDRVHRRRRVGALAIALMLLSRTGIPAAPGQSARSDVCDPRFQPEEGNLGYQWRGDRCEGLYVQPTAAMPVRLSGLQCQGVSFAKDVRLRWTPPPTRPDAIDLRAVSLVPDIIFRMDRRHRESSTEYTWPAPLRRSAGLQGDQIAVLAELIVRSTRPDSQRANKVEAATLEVRFYWEGR
jgi:hypothetical protein